MKAILLAGGYGTRLRPLTINTPKCLVKIGALPLLDIWLYQLFESGVERVLINTHYLHESVEKHIRNSPWRENVELVHEKALLGTAGTIKANRYFYNDDDLLIAHADNLCIVNWQAFFEKFQHRNDNIQATIMLFKTANSKSCGMVSIDENDILTGYVEKPQYPWGNELANGAVMLLDNKSLREVNALEDAKNDLCRDYLPTLVNRANCFVNDELLVDIGTPESLSYGNRVFQSYQHIFSSLGECQ